MNSSDSKKLWSMWPVQLLTVLAVMLLAGCSVVTQCWADARDDLETGIRHYSEARYDKAILFLRPVIADDPELAAEAQLYIAMCRFEMGLLDDAISSCIATLHMAKPEQKTIIEEASITLAKSYMQAGLWEKASPVMESVAKSSPRTAANILLITYDKSGDFQRAAAVVIFMCVDMDGVAHLGKDEFPSWLVASVDKEKANAYIDGFCSKVISGVKFSAEPELRAALQSYLEMIGRYDAVSAMVAASFSKEDTAAERADKLLRLGNVQFRGNKLKEALDSFTKALGAGAELTDVFKAEVKYLTGLCHLGLGDSAAARSEFTELVDQFPKSKFATSADKHLKTLGRSSISKK